MQSRIKRIEWRLTPYQNDFYEHPAKFKAFISGLGAGKTAVGSMLAVTEAVEQEGSLGTIIAPTYGLIEDVIYREFFKWLPEELIAEFKQHKNYLSLVNGSEILFRSADNPRHIERLRGTEITWFWVDEATLLPKLIWDIMIGRLRQPGYKHRAWITGTPKGYNWVYDIFIDNPIQDSYIIHGIPTESNPYLPDDYIETIRNQYKGQFALQEIEGKFVKFEGLVYPGFSRKHIISQCPEYFERVVYGVDWGFRNPGCVLALGVKDDKVYVLKEFYQRKITDDEISSVLQDMMRKYGVGPVFCDPSEPASIEKLVRDGLPAKKAENAVLPGIKQVTSLIEGDNLRVHESCQNLINEFSMYQYDENDKETPIKANDHAMDALRYAVMGLASSRPLKRFYGALS